MAVYLVAYLNTNDHKNIDLKVKELDKNDYYQVQNNVGWLVSFKGTSKQLFNFLCNEGTEEKPMYKESVIITSTEACFGFGEAEMWNWLKAHLEN